MNSLETTLTCVYCGQEYPPGTPSHGSSVLTDHIKVCEKHPMRALEEENTRLRNEIKRFKMDGQPADPVRLTESLDMLNWNRELRASRDKLRAALLKLVGVATNEELHLMEAAIRAMPAPMEDKAAMIDAIHVLIETAEQNTATQKTIE